jgi:hypothetical protein
MGLFTVKGSSFFREQERKELSRTSYCRPKSWTPNLIPTNPLVWYYKANVVREKCSRQATCERGRLAMHACEEMSQTIIDMTIYFIQLQHTSRHCHDNSWSQWRFMGNEDGPSLLKRLSCEMNNFLNCPSVYGRIGFIIAFLLISSNSNLFLASMSDCE